MKPKSLKYLLECNECGRQSYTDDEMEELEFVKCVCGSKDVSTLERADK